MNTQFFCIIRKLLRISYNTIENASGQSACDFGVSFRIGISFCIKQEDYRFFIDMKGFPKILILEDGQQKPVGDSTRFPGNDEGILSFRMCIGTHSHLGDRIFAGTEYTGAVS